MIMSREKKTVVNPAFAAAFRPDRHPVKKTVLTLHAIGKTPYKRSFTKILIICPDIKNFGYLAAAAKSTDIIP